MKKNNGGGTALFLGLLQILGGFMLVAAVSGEKDSLEYYYSSSHRSAVDSGSMIGWLIVFAGVVELVYGLIASSVANNGQSDDTPTDDEEAKLEWFEGEIIEKEWDPNHHQVEWITMRKVNGYPVRLWHYIADDKIYKVGDRGWARSKDRLITEFVPSEDEM